MKPHLTAFLLAFLLPALALSAFADPDTSVRGMRGRPRLPGAAATDLAPATYPTSFFPFIDAFGQYTHQDWPGKTHTLADLAKAKAAEEKDLAAQPGPADWDRYGGWNAGPTLQATGFFRTEKRNGKWWLVDPDGKLFFSNGIDCVQAAAPTPIDDRAAWFVDLPVDKPEFKPFFGQSGNIIRDYFKGRSVATFDFLGANLLRKYGPQWKTQFAELAHRRLRSWGVNTLGNWSRADIYLLRRTPYVVAVGAASKPIQASTGMWGQFKDVFDDDFPAKLRQRMLREAGQGAGDPWCLGYFVDNEIDWRDEMSLAVATLASPADQAAKKAFVEDLKAKYRNIEALNAAWGVDHASWDALLASPNPPERAKAGADLAAFNARIAERYFRTCRDVVKETAPRQLYLGCRFHMYKNAQVIGQAAQFADVVSVNMYAHSPAGFKLPITQDAPIIIGEFHFGARDRGPFHPGLVTTADQFARARAYKEFVTAALQHPNIVGCHWFQYTDQPTIGRSLDGENYQIGFVDVADTPYIETIDACREVGYAMYRTRAGK